MYKIDVFPNYSFTCLSNSCVLFIWQNTTFFCVRGCMLWTSCRTSWSFRLLPSGLTSPSRCLLCCQTSQQSKRMVFIETTLLKVLRFPKISDHLRRIQDRKSSSWSQTMKSLVFLLHLFVLNPANCLFFNSPTILDLYSP